MGARSRAERLGRTGGLAGALTQSCHSERLLAALCTRPWYARTLTASATLLTPEAISTKNQGKPPPGGGASPTFGKPTRGGVAVGPVGVTPGVDAVAVARAGVAVVPGVDAGAVAVARGGVADAVGIAPVGRVVGVAVGVVPAAQPELETVLVSIVTAPFRARALPDTLAPFCRLMLVSARMFPTNVVFVKRSAELPICQNTLQG